MPSLNFYFILLSLIYLSFIQRNFVSSNDMETNAFIYKTDRDVGESIEFAQSMDLWTDIPNLLADEGFETFGLLCVTGAFLLYSRPYFDALDESEIRVVSGKNRCIEPSQVGSIQLLSAFGTYNRSTLSIFTDTKLRGHVFPVSDKTYDIDSIIGKAESVMILGTMGFTVKTIMSKAGDDPFCLKPSHPPDYKFPMCVLSEFEHSILHNNQAFSYISPGCDDEGVKYVDVNITNCIEFGSGDMDESGDSDDGDDTVPDDSPIQGCDDNEEFLTLLDLRFNNNFLSRFQMRYPKDKSLSWRTELVDSAFDVVLALCPEISVSGIILSVMREMFIYVIETYAWGKGEGMSMQNRTDDLKRLVMQTDECVEALQEGKDGPLVSFLLQQAHITYMKLESNETNVTEVSEAFKTVHGYDLVMETVWHVGNLVISACHQTSAHDTDFWLEFYEMFWEMYLVPLTTHWKEPGKFLKYYSTLFGGFHLKEQLKGLALCVTDAFATSGLDPYPRPEAMSAPKVDSE